MLGHFLVADLRVAHSAEEEDVIFCHFPATKAAVSIEQPISSFLILLLVIINQSVLYLSRESLPWWT